MVSSSLRRLVSSICSASLRCDAFDHSLLLANLLGLLLDGVLALVERAFAFVEFLADLGQFVFARGLELDGRLFHFQFGLAAEIGRFAVGFFEDFLGFGFGIAATEPIEKLDGDRAQHRGDDNQNDSYDGIHGTFPL